MTTDHREALGQQVRAIWVEWAREQPNPKPSWLVPWEELDDTQREIDMRIGACLYEDGRRAERDVEDPRIDELTAELEQARKQLAAHVERIASLERMWKVQELISGVASRCITRGHAEQIQELSARPTQHAYEAACEALEKRRVALVQALPIAADTLFYDAVELVRDKRALFERKDLWPREVDRLRRVEDALVRLGAPNHSERGDPGGLMVKWVEDVVAERNVLRSKYFAAAAAEPETPGPTAENEQAVSIHRTSAMPDNWQRQIKTLVIEAWASPTMGAEGLFNKLTDLIQHWENIGKVHTCEAHCTLPHVAEPETPDATPQLFDTVEQAMEQLDIYTVQSTDEPGWYEAVCGCDWRTDGNESAVEDAVRNHAQDVHVRKVETRCPSLFLHDGILYSCDTPLNDHKQTGSGSAGDKWHRSTQLPERPWTTDDDAIPVPWPKDQEPPTGIDVLQDLDEPDSGRNPALPYVRRAIRGWRWTERTDGTGAMGPRIEPWHEIIKQTDGDLVVVRP